jgi:hypothetical protein
MIEPLSDELVLALSKGARLPVYLLLCNHPEGLSQNDLIVLTGCSDHTLSPALQFLALKRLIVRAASSEGYQRWFVTSGLEITSSEGGLANNATPTTTINRVFNLNSEDRNRKGVANNATPSEPDTGGKSLEDWDAIWRELGMASVFKNDRSLAMARLPHISAEYVKKCRTAWKAKKKGGPQWAGAFLTMLESQPVADDDGEDKKSIADKVDEFLRPRRDK